MDDVLDPKLFHDKLSITDQNLVFAKINTSIPRGISQLYRRESRHFVLDAAANKPTMFSEILERLHDSSDLKYIILDGEASDLKTEYNFLTRDFWYVKLIDTLFVGSTSKFGGSSMPSFRQSNERIKISKDGIITPRANYNLKIIPDGSIDLKTLYYSLLNRGADLDLSDPVTWAKQSLIRRFTALIDKWSGDELLTKLYIYLICNARILDLKISSKDQELLMSILILTDEVKGRIHKLIGRVRQKLYVL